MRQLLPTAPADAEADVAAAYAEDRRPHDGRPWVTVNMIASADGAVTLGGLSGGLGGPADRAVFRHLRSLADVILVGAGTARAENYGPPRPPSTARLALVSGRAVFDWTLRVFTEHRPYVVTTEDALVDPAGPVDVIRAGSGRVDLAAALVQLAERGVRTVLCEGGPTLNGHMFAAGLVDELCLTVAPMVVAGDGARAVTGPALDPPARLRLAGVVEEGGELLLRYLR
jgi:riboflavin biosynthesis pyrimidine reductase